MRHSKEDLRTIEMSQAQQQEINHGPRTAWLSAPRLLLSRMEKYTWPNVPVGRSAAVALGVVAMVVVLAIWAALSYSGFVEPFFLPTPSAVLSRAIQVYLHEGYLTDIQVSVVRVCGAFLVAAIVAVPLGIVIGAFAAPAALLEPLIGAIRYMPPVAFVPLLIVWLGIGETEKWSVIWIGVFFPLTLLVAAVAKNVPHEQIQVAYTLGARRREVFWKVLVPAALPGIFDTLRITLGYSWTYLVLAEIIAAESGIGYRIIVAQRYLQTDGILVGILTIGLLGVCTDVLMRVLYRKLFNYGGGAGR